MPLVIARKGLLAEFGAFADKNKPKHERSPIGHTRSKIKKAIPAD